MMALNGVELANLVAFVLGLALVYLAVRFWIETRRSTLAWLLALIAGTLMVNRINAVVISQGTTYEGVEVTQIVMPILVKFLFLLFIVVLLKGYRAEMKDVEASLALESIALGIVQVDLNGIITYANTAFTNMIGFRKNSLVGKPLISVMPESFQAAHQKAFADYLKSGKRTLDWSNIPGKLITAWKTEVPVTIALAEITDSTGIKGFIGIFKRERRSVV